MGEEIHHGTLPGHKLEEIRALSQEYYGSGGLVPQRLFYVKGCNIRLLQSHMRLKKNRPYNYWLKSQGHYLLCFSTSNQSEPIRFVCDMRLRLVTA